MSKKVHWGSISISLPKEFYNISKSGKIVIKPPVTSTGQVASVGKQKAIKLTADDVEKPTITEEGRYTSDVKALAKDYKEVYKLSGEKAKDDYKKKTSTMKGKLNDLLDTEKEFTSNNNSKIFPKHNTMKKVRKELKSTVSEVDPSPSTARKPSSWIAHVKKVAQEKGIPYFQALKVAKESYAK